MLLSSRLQIVLDTILHHSPCPRSSGGGLRRSCASAEIISPMPKSSATRYLSSSLSLDDLSRSTKISGPNSPFLVSKTSGGRDSLGIAARVVIFPRNRGFPATHCYNVSAPGRTESHHEVELGVVIGSRAHRVTPGKAMQVIQVLPTMKGLLP